ESRPLLLADRADSRRSEGARAGSGQRAAASRRSASARLGAGRAARSTTLPPSPLHARALHPAPQATADRPPGLRAGAGRHERGRSNCRGSIDADIIIANAPDPVFVSDLEAKILQANDAVSQLLGFRQDEVLEQSLSRFISPEETREFTAALREVVERGVMRNVVLNP